MNAAEEIERVARLSHGRLVAILAGRTGNVTAAMDAVSQALLRALELWPTQGVPERPEAWLVTVARNRMADEARRRQRDAMAHRHLLLLEEERSQMANAAEADPTINLMFVCAHPAIDERMRTPLMLQLVLGLDARRMSSAFLVAPGTLSQRLTRARAKIEASAIGFALPEAEAMPSRLRHVLDAIYAAFTVGLDGDGSSDAKASSLAREALWLGSILAARLPREAEAQALLALMLYTRARRPARIDAHGRLVPLDRQDTSLWDRAMLADADLAMGMAASRASLGRYQLEAAIAAAHCDRRHGRPTDWAMIAALYRGLVQFHPTIGARVALAAALAQAGELAPALMVLDAIDAASLGDYQPWWAVRAHVLSRLQGPDAAAPCWERAIALASDPAIRSFLAESREHAGFAAGSKLSQE